MSIISETGRRLLPTVALAASLLLQVAQPGLCQGSGHNYVLTRTYLDSLGIDVVTSISYHDGLGRVEQTADNGDVSGTYNHTRTMYDQLGRPSMQWLKVSAGTSGALLTPADISRKALLQYSDSRPMKRTTYDALGRVTCVSGPGAAWATAGAATTYTYQSNADDELPCRHASSRSDALPPSDRFYAAGELECIVTASEDGIVSRRYTDIAGRVVAERLGDALTQYVYDELGQLRFVLTPDFHTASDTAMSAYRYAYDAHGRLASKTLPGCEPVLYCYDGEGRLCGIQDGRLRDAGLWRFVLYDVFGREAVRGTCSEKPKLKNGVVTFGYNQKGIFGSGYVVLSAGLKNPRLESVSYYDSYLFTKDGFAAHALVGRLDGLSQTAWKTPHKKGFKTGELVAAGDSSVLVRAFLYDSQSRLSATGTLLPDGRYTEERTAYTFTGKPQSVVSRYVHGDRSFTFVTTCSYNAVGKPSSVVLTMPDGTEVPIAHNTYDRLGRLLRMERGTGLADATSYAYNLRGWITSIDSPHFKERLHYTDGPGTPRYGGDASSLHWQSDSILRGYRLDYDEQGRLTSAVYGEGDDLSANTGRYDESVLEYTPSGSPLRIARRGLQNDGSFGLVDDLTLTYHGQQLYQVADKAPSTDYENAFGFSDRGLPQPGVQNPSPGLGMGLETGIGAGSAIGSAPSQPLLPGMEGQIYLPYFTYDGNGAVAHDPYRGIYRTTYDHNGMPRHIEFSNGHFVDYQYALDGTRLREGHGVRRTTTQIVGGKAHTVTSRMLADSLVHIAPWLEYNGKKYYYKFQGGYYAFTLHRTTHEPNLGRLYFYACDHQGNVRSVLHADGAVVKEVQQTHYYPFGGPIAGLGTAPGFQRRKYNGKVLDRLYGLDLYDYAARQYDPVLLRFTSPDPLAEKMYGQSVYGYCKDNPVNRIDPDGMDDYYTQEGDFLFRDDKSTDNIIIANTYNLKMRRVTGAEWLPIGKPLKNTILSAKAYSRIFTDILSKMPEVDVGKLHEGQVSVNIIDEDVTSNLSQYTKDSYNEPSNIKDTVASTGQYKGKQRLTAYINVCDNKFLDYYSTVSNVQNLLGVHEYIGHYVYNLRNSRHDIIYKMQMKHFSWKKTTTLYKEHILDGKENGW